MLIDIVILIIYFIIIVPIIFWGYDWKGNCYRTRKCGRPTLINYFKSVYSLKWIGYLVTQTRYECSKYWDNRYPWFDDNPDFPKGDMK